MYFYVPAADVSVLPREMSRSDRGVRNREARSVFQNSSRRRKKKRPRSTPQSLKNVRAKGLEPIRTKAPDPKSGLATNYNTLANPFRKTHNMKPIAEYDLVGSCRILCPKRNAKIVKDFQFSKPVRIFVKNTEKKYDICASKRQIERTVDQNWKRRLAELREANNNAAWSMSEFINETPCAITERLMKEADPSGELPEEILYAAFMAGFCGISEDDTTINGYFQDAVHCLETRKYRDNPYLKNIKFPDTATRHWKFTHYSYRPYEAFICNDIDIDKNLREVPQIGFFRERFAYPAVEQDGREWMAVKPSEIETMRAPIEEAMGKVVTFGLGLGYFAYMVSEKPDVTSLDIVERSEEAIALFERHILPQFPNKEKIRIIRSDAFWFLNENMWQDARQEASDQCREETTEVQCEIGPEDDQCWRNSNEGQCKRSTEKGQRREETTEDQCEIVPEEDQCWRNSNEGQCGEEQNRASRSTQRGMETANREKMQGRYDYAFIDLWHDTADGLEMYLKAKRIENKLHTAGLQTKFAYWVEKSLLSAYRWTVFEKTLAECTTEEGAFARLSDDCLRREAGQTV